MITGPLPITKASPLSIELRPSRPADRRAVRDGTSRAVTTGREALDRAAYVETELSEREVHAIFEGETGDSVARAVRDHRARLRLRPGWAYLELAPSAEIAAEDLRAIAHAVALLANRTRDVRPDAPVLEPEGGVVAGLGYLGAVLGGYGLWWTFGWARLERDQAFMPSPSALLVLTIGLAVALTAMIFVRSAARRALRGRTGAHRRAFAYALATALWLGPAASASVLAIDVLADGAPARPFVGPVTSVVRSFKGNLSGVCVEAAGTRRCVDLHYPSDHAFDGDPMGTVLALDVRPGALGLPWTERVRRAE